MSLGDWICRILLYKKCLRSNYRDDSWLEAQINWINYKDMRRQNIVDG